MLHKIRFTLGLGLYVALVATVLTPIVVCALVSHTYDTALRVLRPPP
jgi:hypothetical protein